MKVSRSGTPHFGIVHSKKNPIFRTCPPIPEGLNFITTDAVRGIEHNRTATLKGFNAWPVWKWEVEGKQVAPPFMAECLAREQTRALARLVRKYGSRKWKVSK